MRKLSKRFLSLLMALALVLSLVPAIALADESTNPVTEWNVTLKDNIGANFYLHLDDPANTVVNFTVAGEVTAIRASDATQQDGCYVFTVELAAAQMTDDINMDVLVSGVSVFSKAYSVKEYADKILAGDYDAEVKAMVLTMLHYGAATQNYFSYNLNSLANAGCAELTPAEVPTSESEVGEMSLTGTVSGISYYGASLVFQSRIALRYYFTLNSGNISDYTFTVGETAYTPVEKDGRYYVEIPEIYPQNLNKQYTLTVSKGTETMSVTYGPMNYVVRQNSSAAASEAMKAMVQMLYTYHEEAVEYVAYAENLPYVELQSQMTLGDALSSTYYMDGEDPTVKTKHAIGNANGTANVTFPVAQNIGSNQYLKFAYKFDAIQGAETAYDWGIVVNNGTTLSLYPSSARDMAYMNANGLYIYEADGITPVSRFQNMQAGVWYTFYVQMQNDATECTVACTQYDYWSHSEHPTVSSHIKNVDYLAKIPYKELNAQITLGSALATEYYMDGTDEAVKVSHNYNLSSKWSNIGVKFRVKDNIGENNYLKFSFKFDALADKNLGQTMYIFNKGTNISAGNWASNGVICCDEAGKSLSYSDLQAGQWYDLYVKITDKTGEPGDYYVAFYQTDYDKTESHPNVTAYVKNVTYVSAVPYETLKSQVKIGSRLSSAYQTEGGDELLKVWHSVARSSGWGDVGVHFDLTNQGDNQYVKFTYKVDPIQGAETTYPWEIFIYNGSSITLKAASTESVAAIKNKGCYIYEAGTTTEADFHNLETGKWYDFYLKINAADCYIVGSQEGYSDVSEHPDVASYMKDIEFRATFPFEEIKSQITLGSALATEFYMDGTDEAVKISHNYNLASKWANIGVQFNVKDNIGENNYLKFSFKFDALADAALGQTMYIFNKGTNISAGNWASNGVICCDGAGNMLSYSDLQAGQWYDLYVKINDKTGTPGQYYVAFYQADYDNAESHPNVTAYVKNTTYVSTAPYETLKSQVTVGSNLSSAYQMDGGDEMLKVWHNVNHETSSGWGNVGLHFDLTDQGDNQYVKFTYKVDVIQGADATYQQVIYIYNGNNISLYKASGNSTDVIKSRGCYIYEVGTATEVDFHNIEAGVWYDFYVKVNAADCYIIGSQAYYTSASEHPDVSSYMKNVEFVNTLPAA